MFNWSAVSRITLLFLCSQQICAMSLDLIRDRDSNIQIDFKDCGNLHLLRFT